MLTDRERQIMTLVSDGLSNKEIARRLNIADGTIKVHLHHIFQKLNRATGQCLPRSLYRSMTTRVLFPGSFLREFAVIELQPSHAPAC